MPEMLRVILVLVIVGVVCWLVFTYVPMPPIFQTLIIIAVIICFLIWAIRMVGGSGSLP